MEFNDNYYSTKEYEDFSLNIGKYWGKSITSFEPIKASWGEEIELAVSMEKCLSKNNNQIKYRDEWVSSSENDSITLGRNEYAYKILKEISLNYCQSLAPNINGNCIQSNLLKIYDWGGGSSGWTTFQIYGLFKLLDNTEYIFPLKRFVSLDDDELTLLLAN